MLVQGGGGAPPLNEGKASRPDKFSLVDGNSNHLIADAEYSYRDLEPRRNGTLRVTFSDIEIISSAKPVEEEEEVEESRVPDMVDQGPPGQLPPEQNAYRSKQLRPEYEGWDNPFRAEGEVSQDADIIIQLWRENRLKGDLAELLRSKAGLKSLLEVAENQSKSDGKDETSGHPSSRNGAATRLATATAPPAERLAKPAKHAKFENSGKSESVHGSDKGKKSEKKNKFEVQCCSLM